MADVAEQVEEVIQKVAENVSDTITGARKTPASLEGAAVAYTSLIIMAMLPIFFGALRSVKHQKDQKVGNRTGVSASWPSCYGAMTR